MFWAEKNQIYYKVLQSYSNCLPLTTSFKIRRSFWGVIRSAILSQELLRLSRSSHDCTRALQRLRIQILSEFLLKYDFFFQSFFWMPFLWLPFKIVLISSVLQHKLSRSTDNWQHWLASFRYSFLNSLPRRAIILSSWERWIHQSRGSLAAFFEDKKYTRNQKKSRS